MANVRFGVERANFFEQRATEYSKGATRGDWNTMWSSFDNRQGAKAKAANEAGEARDALEGPGLFDAGLSGAGSVAAE